MSNYGSHHSSQLHKLASLAIVIAFFLSHAPLAKSASYDCAKASTHTEILICQDAYLSRLDEHYSRLYKHVLANVVQTKEQSRIKRIAIQSLRDRNNDCASRTCLMSWYVHGRARLIKELAAFHPASLQHDLTPELLYKKLSLRSFPGLHGQRVKYYCESYLSDYFPTSVVTMSANSLVIDDGDEYWKLDILDSGTVSIASRVYAGSYNTSTLEQVYFEPGAQELRIVGDRDQSVPYEIAQAQNCVTYSAKNGNDSMAVQPTSIPLPSPEVLDSRSVGEFNLSMDHLAESALPIFNEPAGQKIGRLVFDVKFDGVEGSIARFSVDSINSTKQIEPQVIYRAKFYPSLLIFDRSKSWFNISADQARQAWIQKADLPKAVRTRFRTRETVLLEASQIKVKSAHRLRAEPNTNSDILKVIQHSENTEVLPLSLNGDWMQVRTITPQSFSMTLKEVLNNPDYVVIEGWLKWRKSPTQQYVDAEYHYGM